MTKVAAALVGLVLAGAVVYAVLNRNATIAGPSSGGAASLTVGPKAPDFTGITGWVNSPPLTLLGLRGKVVLVDFWTYSCINCQRTLPVLRTWWQRYQAEGLVIVGVHSPEFDFEKDPANVRRAVQELDVTWPVAMDPEMATWNAYQNQYWPAEYLIDKQGYVRHTQFGEGDYDVTEQAIRTLLGVKSAGAAAQATLPGLGITQEAYAGSDRSDGQITLNGPWTVDPEYALSSGSGATAEIQFTATHVYMVAGAVGAPVTVAVSVDGRPLPAVTVTANDLYALVSLPDQQSHLLKITPSGRLQLFTFTFG